MKKKEYLLNILLGVSLIYWGIAGFWMGLKQEELSVIRIFITILNLLVGVLILTRKPALETGALRSMLISLPSLICGGLLFKLAMPLHLWSIYGQGTFILGGAITVVSFLFLGRNFSILPAMRETVSKGAYRWVRHPAYFGEMLMLTACLFCMQSYWSVLPFVIFFPAIVYRILEEQKLLSTYANYSTYMAKVKWRLLPYIW